MSNVMFHRISSTNNILKIEIFSKNTLIDKNHLEKDSPLKVALVLEILWNVTNILWKTKFLFDVNFVSKLILP